MELIAGITATFSVIFLYWFISRFLGGGDKR